jgi:hypothetical protein
MEEGSLSDEGYSPLMFKFIQFLSKYTGITGRLRMIQENLKCSQQKHVS